MAPRRCTIDEDRSPMRSKTFTSTPPLPSKPSLVRRGARNITRPRDVLGTQRGEHKEVQIVIEVDRWQPPEGTIFLRSELDAADELLTSSFAGWLGLVARLSDLFGQAAQPFDTSGPPG
jgi:hypothetical protein